MDDDPELYRPKKGLFKKGDLVGTKIPHVPKGRPPYSEPKKVEKVLGYYSFLLSDGKVWNARNLKPYRRPTTAEDGIIEESWGHVPALRLRRSRRPNLGKSPNAPPYYHSSCFVP
ncbi:MAG: hypothetical protein GY696_14375 [Gammaproteobacteria bacterium]|nr:hypothetical protein [Gammaproteobacteria bacterium]